MANGNEERNKEEIESFQKEQTDQIDDLFADLGEEIEAESGGTGNDKEEKEAAEIEEGGEKQGSEEAEAEKVAEGDKAIEEEAEAGVEEKEEKEVEAKPKEEEEGVEVSLEEQNKLLIEQIEKLSGGAPATIVPVKKEEEAKAEVPAIEEGIKLESIPEIVQDFIGDVNIDDLVSDKKLLNEVLVKVATASRENTIQTMLRAIPQIVVQQTRSQAVIKTVIDEFYDANKELIPVKKTVGAVANQIYAEESSLGIDKVLEKAAEKTRKMLGLKKEAIQNKEKKTVERERKPALVKNQGGGTREKEKVDVSDLQKDIDSTLDL